MDNATRAEQARAALAARPRDPHGPERGIVTYTVMKQNVPGSRRTFKTGTALARAVVRAGAQAATVGTRGVLVKWNDEVPERLYPVGPDGLVDYQLAWDLDE